MRMRIIFAIALMSMGMAAFASDVDEPWVSQDANGQLHYRTTGSVSGDRIMDFSSVGSRYGVAADNAVDVSDATYVVSPSGSDDADAIQKMLNSAAAASAKMEMEVKSPGAIKACLMKPGVYQLSKPLTIKSSYVELRGSGKETILKLTGKPHVFLTIGNGTGAKPTGLAVSIVDPYVPSGATTFHVKDASPFKVGDDIIIRKPITDEWVHFMGMDTMVRNGKPEKWVSGQIVATRHITNVEGNTLTIGIPLSDSLDAKFLGSGGATVSHAKLDRIERVGVSHLRIEAPPQAALITDPLFSGVRITAVVDAWVNDVAMHNVVGAVSVGAAADRVTLQHVFVTHDVPTKGSAKPADFEVSGSQVLLDRCTSKGDGLFYFVTGARATGPIVLLECDFAGTGWIQPHQRWATGLLLDNCHVDGGGIDFMNRGEMGSGHGWTIGWAVAWNCTARSFIIQNPPGAMNFAIGCQGKRETAAMPFAKEPKIPEGTYQSHGMPVAPASLYRAQLEARQKSEK